MPSNWPMFMQNPAHGALSAGTPGPVAPPTLLWSVVPGGAIQSCPVLGSDGTVYITSNDKKMYALNPTTGATLWSYSSGYGFYKRGALVGPKAGATTDVVYLNSYDASMGYVMVALDAAARGRPLWKVKISDVACGPAMIAPNGNIIVVTSHSLGGQVPTVYALNPANGTTVWSCLLTDAQAISAQPVVVPASSGTSVAGNVLVIDIAGNLYQVRSDGTDYELFMLSALVPGSRVTASPCLDSTGSNLLVMVTGAAPEGNQLISLPLVNMAASWAMNFAGQYFSTYGAVASDPSGYLYVGCNSLVCYSPAGTLSWNTSVLNYPSPVAMDSNGTIYLTTEDNHLVAVESIQGSVLWSVDGPGKGGLAPALGADGTVFACAADGTVYAYGPS